MSLAGMLQMMANMVTLEVKHAVKGQHPLALTEDLEVPLSTLLNPTTALPSAP